MLQKSDCLGFDELVDHVAQDSTDGVEALVSMADVCEACFVEEDLLDDEDRHRFGEFRASFHDAKAEGYDFRGEKEVDDGIVVILLQSGECFSTRLRERACGEHTLTKAPITPRDVRRRYSKGRVLEVVFRKGYKNSGI